MRLPDVLLGGWVHRPSGMHEGMGPVMRISVLQIRPRHPRGQTRHCHRVI